MKLDPLNDGFKAISGISDDEEKFFNYLYKRERRFKIAIAILTFVIIALLVLK